MMRSFALGLHVTPMRFSSLLSNLGTNTSQEEIEPLVDCDRISPLQSAAKIRYP
ncbi:MAG TPA: hypothetical protein V6D14_02795 [Coleofasciculaceae cyanobacterium]